MAPLDRQVSDSDLVRAAVAGDLQALGTLVERHFGAVYAVALARLRDVDLAQDLAQEVFLRAQLHLDQLGPTGHFAAWTVRIARNLAIDWQRRGLRASRLLPLVPLDTLTHGVPDSQAQGVRETMAIQEEHRALHGAILALPAEQREVMLLHLSDDLSQREIAERLGVNQSTVSRLMRRAMATLRGALEPALRDVAPSLRPPAPAVARSMALVLAVGAMSGVAKASLAASATVGPLASTVETAKAGAAASLGLIGLFKSLPTLLAAGGKLMATGKGIAATVATVA
ncbi:RNA polymerase sigma factor, partial [Candidatus Sumerlaeota bacterium]|nr:RNA polymerase sigma factor [Candidatus Sumerlaeota bacterium]